MIPFSTPRVPFQELRIRQDPGLLQAARSPREIAFDEAFVRKTGTNPRRIAGRLWVPPTV
jgi:hypothetical protein